jgi:transcriptional regulator with XRE-family HTH domain
MDRSIEIKIALMKAGVTQAELARELGCHRTGVNHIVKRRRRDRRIESYIEDRCGVARGELFPDLLEEAKEVGDAETTTGCGG